MSLDKRKFDIDFDKAKNLGEFESNTTFQIKEFDVVDTKYGTMLYLVDVEGNHYYTYSEVIVPKFVKSINTGVKLQKAVVTFKKVESGFDSETGEIITYYNLDRATSEEANSYHLAKSERRSKALENHNQAKEVEEEVNEEE